MSAPGRGPTPSSLSVWEQSAYSLPQVGINLMGVMIAEWLTFFYRPPADEGRPALVGAMVFAALMLLGRLIDGIADPLVGHLSDRSRSRWGRRIPFVVLGTPALALSFGALWFPPDPFDSPRNAIFLGAALGLYWVAFTVVVGPYYALLPEIARGARERVRLSSVMALFTALGTLAAGIGVGQLQSAHPDGLVLSGVEIGSGIQAFGLVAAVVTALTFWVLPFGVRERPHSVSKEVPPGLVRALRTAFCNPSFRCFLGLSVFVQLGLLVFVTGLPYLCTTILERPSVVLELGPIEVVFSEPGLVGPGRGEAWTGTFQAILFGLAIVAIPLVNLAAARWGRNRLMVSSGVVFAVVLSALPLSAGLSDPAIGVLVAVILLAFPASCALVLVNAIAADVVDYDEARSGLRREGIYAGASALVAKSAQGLGPALVVGLLALFGDSRASPAGILLIAPVSAVLILFGVAIFSRTPIDDAQ